jgi:hypothetical protein
VDLPAERTAFFKLCWWLCPRFAIPFSGFGKLGRGGCVYGNKRCLIECNQHVGKDWQAPIVSSVPAGFTQCGSHNT